MICANVRLKILNASRCFCVDVSAGDDHGGDLDHAVTIINTFALLHCDAVT